MRPTTTRHLATLFALMFLFLAPVCVWRAAALTQTVSPTLTATPSAATPAATVSYTVRPGDTLFRIATRFGTTVRAIAAANGITNTSLIYVGQVLQIPTVATPTPSVTATAPAASATPLPTATVTTTPDNQVVYVVQRGDTLFRIAARFSTTVAAILRTNNLQNPNLIFVGQRLIIPTDITITPTPLENSAPTSTTATPTLPANGTLQATVAPTITVSPEDAAIAPETPTPVVNAPTTATQPTIGIAAFFDGQNITSIIGSMEQLGASWAKVDVRWRDLEAEQGSIDFATLDAVVEGLGSANIRILFTVSTAPDWARTSLDENGPPDDFATFANFAGILAERYSGRIAAYQIWSEPNLRREWNSALYPISAPSYVEMLRLAHDAIKQQDADALVVTAGLAPTGFNDGINAIDDRIYLRTLYESGVDEYSDAIGAHPAGYANPPDARCCEQPDGVETHYQDRSFFFLDTLTDYRDIMQQNGDDATQIWVTKFGWGSSEDATPPSASNVFYSYTSLGEQALYTPRALELGAELGYVGPMFIWNLNGCVARAGDAEACYSSLLAPDGEPRPVYETLALQAETDAP
ncbi:MAG: LysM peptidoglycan-binding domain-containing protein [Chloroflexota bacterium]|nr:LysM peptidoglycan-binding domain-containing protein [Chloroflexota bacterium]